MNNLLQETLKDLAEHGKTPADVLWVGNSEIKTDWANFAEIADIKYDNGYGGAEIAQDLKIVGADFWLERHEYDGSEWWEFKTLPKAPAKTCKLKSVKGTSWWHPEIIMEVDENE
jgi:hypothetical protein